MSDTSGHLARLLLLVDTFSEPGGAALDGLTKLAKLDFLARYPAFLERLNERRGILQLWQAPREAERVAVEEPMIRYRYGPWDERYYVLIGGLVGRDLVEYVDGRGSVALRVTEAGHDLASRLRASSTWATLADRMGFLRENYDEPGSQLKAMIYEAFPNIADSKLRAVIPASPGGAST